jgi:formylglycine-generating enzyme required for sulfatase activity
MKQITLILTLLIVANIFGQKPQTVYSIVKDRHEISWYETQFDLWEKEVEKNNKDANAWYNYYASSRALRNLTQGDDRKLYDSLCGQITDQAYEAVPNTFEGNHLKWWNSGNDEEAFKYLKKAYEISPNDSRSYVDLMTYYETKLDYENYSKFCKLHYEANELSAPILNWGYNILAEAERNAIILSAGDNDTYPIWTIQEYKSFRKDVKNINTSLILLDDYRNKLFNQLNLPALDIDFTKIKSMEDYQNKVNQVYEHILTNYDGPIHVCVGAIHQLDDWSDNLHLVGLSYFYSEEGIDNISIIKRNYENRYLLDYLQEVFSHNISNSVADYMNALYLPSMVKLYKHYVKSESKDKQTKLLQLIIQISERSGQQTEIADLLEEEASNSSDFRYITMLLNTKTIEKKMKEIVGNLWASETEVTNLEYRMFLNNLKNSRNDELYNKCLYDSAAWVKEFEVQFTEPMESNYHWHPAYDEYPVVNISYDAAVEYCKWLTQQYNSQRKRKYTQVVFRLPTEEEWRLMAIPGGETDNTCFKDDNVQNEKGCYLANIKVGEGNYNGDGGFFPVKADSYFPNDKGFYCTMGNVAEMISKEGVAKGGSWYNSFEESKFNKIQSYDGPDPRIGFRVIMEIIQE